MWTWLVRFWRSVTDWKRRPVVRPYYRSNLHGRR